MKNIHNLMQQAISGNVFPGGVLLVSKEDSVVFFKAYGYANIFSKRLMTKETLFDLASLTKPLATTPAIMKLVQGHKLGLEQNIGSVLVHFNKTEKHQIKIRHLLRHASGLPDYRPYYKKLYKIPISLRKDALKDLLIKEPLINPIGKKCLYSDLGFMILCQIVESISGKRLDRYVDEAVYKPLGCNSGGGLFFVDTNTTSRSGKFAATELCPWRNVLLEGVVHDENAYVMGGIEGHAGLFGTAQDVHNFLSALLFAYHGLSSTQVFQKDLLIKFLEKEDDAERTLGFDTPSLRDASCGKLFSKNSVGHLGFTGTSFWMDIDSSVIVILLTNRVHPSRENTKIKAFRPEIHNIIMKSIKENKI